MIHDAVKGAEVRQANGEHHAKLIASESNGNAILCRAVVDLMALCLKP